MKSIMISVFIIFHIIVLNSQPIFRACEGGGIEVSIDSTTPLKDLVERLENDWKFEETGKGYWIGYTDDMFSIARYGENAIPYLAELTKPSKSYHTRIGALYSLHLIGINSTITGRFYEEFIDTNARIELLKHIQDTDLHRTAVSLLMRDPWTIDLDYYMDYLERSEVDYSFVLSALKRYDLDSNPFNHNIPDTILTKEIKVKVDDSWYAESKDIIRALKKYIPLNIKIDKIIRKSKEQYMIPHAIGENVPEDAETSLDWILYILEGSDSAHLYCSFNSRLFYAYKNETLYIFGKKDARNIWLKWWKKQKNNGS
jgi:hypothetical protein